MSIEAPWNRTMWYWIIVPLIADQALLSLGEALVADAIELGFVWVSLCG